MKLKVFAIHDQAAEAYLQPFFMQTRGQAIRALTDTMKDESTTFNKHPQDYTLFEVGEYDDSTGSLIPHDRNVSLGNLVEYKEREYGLRPQTPDSGIASTL